MQRPWHTYGSSRHFVVFEKTARLASFTNAAHELNVQQPAVSATIRQLEESLGVLLFTRDHKKVTLTLAGEKLYRDVTRCFEELSHAVSNVQQISKQNYVTLNASTAFNNYWIMPRLAALQRKHPEIALRLQSSDREPEIDTENISFAVRRGDGNWPKCESVLIAKEVIYPVASPRTMKAAKDLTAPEFLLNHRLIHLEEPIRERPTWEAWFASFSIKYARPDNDLLLNDYALVLQAAMAGEGFAFGWKHLTDRLVDQGLLAAQMDWQWQTGEGFYLVWSKKNALSDDALLVKEWILSNRF